MKCLNIEELTTEQKIGQLMVARGYSHEGDREFIFDLLKNKSLGGLQLPLSPNSAEEAELVNEAAGYPVLICADMERGFPKSEYQIPSMLSLGIAGDEELAYQVGAVTAIEAKRHGYNTVWGPVVDLLAGNANCKVPRCLGEDPEAVGRMATAILKGYHDNGMVTTAKHWPCGLDVKEDSHIFSTVSELTEEELVKIVFAPYKYAMDKGELTGIMTGHTICANVDDLYPGTLSEKLISIVRRQGFDGLIMTDSFAMIGIQQKFGADKCPGLAVRAGNDMILVDYRVPARESYEHLLRAYREGVFSEERLNDAVKHVLAAQQRTLPRATASSVSAYQKECFDRIERESFCAVTDKDTSSALSKDGKKLFVVLVENVYASEDGESLEISDSTAITLKDYKTIKETILSKFPNSEVDFMSQRPSGREVSHVCHAATKADQVIFLTSVSSRAYRASENLTEHIITVMRSMKEKISAVIHFGNPYAMERVPHVPRILFSAGAVCKDRAVSYALDILNGDYKPIGTLPIKLQLQ